MNNRPLPEISADRIDEMVAAFKEYDANHPKVGRVNMKLSGYSAPRANDPDFCGSPGCHAGLFGVLFVPKGITYRHAAIQMAIFLFEDAGCTQDDLETWADRSGHWPNGNGWDLFTESAAFGCALGNTVPVKQIIKVWEMAAASVRGSQ